MDEVNRAHRIAAKEKRRRFEIHGYGLTSLRHESRLLDGKG
jgi:hypothetical protein